MKIILTLLVFFLVVPISVEGAGIRYYQTSLDLNYREIGCVDYIIEAIPKGEVGYLEFEGGIKEMVVSVTPEELKPGESNNVQVCFRGKKSCTGEVVAMSQRVTDTGIGSATGMAVSAPLKINVNRSFFFISILFAIIGVGLVIFGLVARKYF